MVVVVAAVGGGNIMNELRVWWVLIKVRVDGGGGERCAADLEI